MFRRSRRLLPVALTSGVVLAGGCDRVKSTLRGAPAGDPVWQGDSTLIASRPTVLYRVVRSPAATRIIPIATAGKAGFEPLFLSDRGWRLMDLTYLHSNARVVPIRGGDLLSPIAVTRGMWEGAPLDTVAGCSLMPPAALIDLPGDIELTASGGELKATAVAPLSDGDLQTALGSIPTLIAPAAGVPPSLISRYVRKVFVVPTGATTGRTIVVTFDDPDAVPDSVPPIAQRPREIIIVLDRGIYGYKPTYVFKTVGNAKDQLRRRFLGAFDADGDGRAELFFGLQSNQWTLVTYALKWDSDAWHDAFRYEKGRCHA